MKKLLLFGFVLLVSISVSFSQNESRNQVDSLKQFIEYSNDTYSLIKSNGQLCWLQRNKQPDEALNYGNTALALISDYPEYDSLKAEILNYLGVVHRNNGDYSAAMAYYFDAHSSAQKFENIQQLAYSNNNLGGIFTLKGDYSNAIIYLEEAFKEFKLLNDIRGLGFVSINLGNLYRHNGDFNQAIEYFNTARQYKSQLGDVLGEATAMNLQAMAYYDIEEFDQAAQIYEQLEKIYSEYEDFRGMAMVKIYQGLISIEQEKYKLAILDLNVALSYNQKLDFKQGQSVAYTNLGLAYHLFNDQQKSFEFLKKGYDLAKEVGDAESLIRSYQVHSQVYNGLGDYKKAFEYQNLYVEQLQKNIQHNERERLTALKINLEVGKKDELNQLLEKKNNELESKFQHLSKTLWIYRISVLVIFLLLLLLGLRTWYLSKGNKNKQNDNRELKKAIEDLKEANHLREKFLSIIGHDLKNPFNSVLGLTSLLVDEWEGIPEGEKRYIINEINGTGNSLYELMDNLLLWAKNQNEALQLHKEEFDLNEIVIDVYELFRNQASFKEIKIQMEIGKSNTVFADPNMINTVIRNLVSNALKFTRKSGKVLIEIKRKANEVEFCITDNGKGILPEDLKRILDDKSTRSTKGTDNETGTGLGLLLVKDFVRQCNGLFWVDSKPGVGSIFCFTLPSSE